MREIGTIVEEKDARVLADYLLTLGITTKLAPKVKGDGWIVWVHREERVEEARKAFDDYRANPSDPLYHAAAPTAKVIRKQAKKTEASYHKRIRDFRNRWEGPVYYRAPLTFALVVVSVLVTAWISMIRPLDFIYLCFSLKFVDAEGILRGNPFEQIMEGQVWRLVTPIFLHFGLPHLFFNMLGTLYLGERIEFRKGTWRLLVIVLVSAIASDSAQAFKSGGGFGGMSGVVFALSSYLWIKGHVHPEDHLKLDQTSTNWMIGWFLLGVVAAGIATEENKDMFPYNMANIAHGVGLAVGMVFGLLKF